MNTSNFSKANMITIKAVVIAVLTLLMLIPVSMVKSLINERMENKARVGADISSKWGGEQRLTGPILVLPYKSANNREAYAYFLPQELNIDGDLNTEKRKRNVYEFVCFQSAMKINGNFKYPEISKLSISPEKVKWEDAFLLIGISHLQGIKNQIEFKWNSDTQEVLSSVPSNDIISSGLTVKVPINPNAPQNLYKFDFELSLNGSGGMYFTPTSKQTHIQVKSKWDSPNFSGNFLPNTRDVSSAGFDATWDIFDYNQNSPQMWIGRNDKLLDSELGVELIQPVDQYTQSMRSVKYAVMFIALTFALFFLVELLSKNRRIHPIQYLLVSFALILFYCLLLSLSEYISFALAYLGSAIAIVLLITSYSHTIFKNLKHTILIGVFFSVLYLFLYVVLRAENVSLLLGSVGLFIALASIMFVTRKVNWYKEKNAGQMTIE